MARTKSANAGASTGMPELSPHDYERLADFRYLLRRFLLFSTHSAEAAGLTSQQHQALLAIKGYRGAGPMTGSSLAERLAIRHHSAGGLIDRLEAKSLIRRAVSPADRRQGRIELTDAAERLLRDLSVAHRDELKNVAPLLRGLLAAFDEVADQA